MQYIHRTSSSFIHSIKLFWNSHNFRVGSFILFHIYGVKEIEFCWWDFNVGSSDKKRECMGCSVSGWIKLKCIHLLLFIVFLTDHFMEPYYWRIFHEHGCRYWLHPVGFTKNLETVKWLEINFYEELKDTSLCGNWFSILSIAYKKNMNWIILKQQPLPTTRRCADW